MSAIKIYFKTKMSCGSVISIILANSRLASKFLKNYKLGYAKYLNTQGDGFIKICLYSNSQLINIFKIKRTKKPQEKIEKTSR